jgi:hypothetical protein
MEGWRRKGTRAGRERDWYRLGKVRGEVRGQVRWVAWKSGMGDLAREKIIGVRVIVVGHRPLAKFHMNPALGPAS